MDTPGVLRGGRCLWGVAAGVDAAHDAADDGGDCGGCRDDDDDCAGDNTTKLGFFSELAVAFQLRA
eukprot:2973871-Pleurochrysis_carterae.AAC.1